MLSSDLLMSIADEIIKSSIFQVSISGGEPLLVENIKEIIEKFALNDTDVLVCSTGNGLNKEIVDVLRNYSIPIQISLDSNEENIHNYLRGSSTAYSIALDAISSLAKSNVNVSVSFCASTINYLHLESVLQLCISLGVPHISIGETIEADGINKGLVLNGEIYKDYLFNLKSNVSKYSDLINISINSEWGFIFDPFFEHAPCTAYDRDCAILYDGNISPCPFVRKEEFFLGNLLEESMQTLWSKRKDNYFYLNKNIGCDKKCIYYDNCLSGCKAMQANTNLPLNKKDIRCPVHRKS
jgi:radical SAM protein with 4Fe4S-binding SPASM domain